MRRIITCLLIFSLLLSLSLPVLAQEVTEPSETVEVISEVTEPSESTEPTETTPEPSEPVTEPFESTEPTETTPESSEPSEPVTEPSESTEPTETTPEPSEPSETVPKPSEPLKVDITENSINAIANAVSTSSENVVTLTNKNGVVVELKNATFMEEFPYFVVVTDFTNSTFHSAIFYSANPFTYEYSEQYSTPRHYFYGTKIYRHYFKYGSELGTESLNYSSIHIDAVYPIVYSNFDLNYRNGSGVHYYSDLPSPKTVSFVTGFDDLTVDNVSVNPGISFVPPEITYDGYKFDGWYLDKELTKPYFSDYVFTSDTTLYAKWTKYVTVSFVTGLEDFELDSVQVLSGEPYSVPSFSYSGYEFLGAYTDESFEKQFVGGTVIDSDITLYLRFEEIVYDMGALIKEQTERMEVLIYVQMAQSVMLGVVIIALFAFRRRDGLGC